MPRFSEASEVALASCDPRLQDLLRVAIKRFDFRVLEGHRSLERQQEMFASGVSKARPGQSKHNLYPSLAVDIAPYPIDWADREQFTLLAGYLMGLAESKGINLRWGGDWDQDFEVADNRFDDLPHFEIVE